MDVAAGVLPDASVLLCFSLSFFLSSSAFPIAGCRLIFISSLPKNILRLVTLDTLLDKTNCGVGFPFWSFWYPVKPSPYVSRCCDVKARLLSSVSALIGLKFVLRCKVRFRVQLVLSETICVLYCRRVPCLVRVWNLWQYSLQRVSDFSRIKA